jgi:hypothetical protein
MRRQMTQCVLLKNPTAPGWILKCAKLGGVGGRKRERQKERARAREGNTNDNNDDDNNQSHPGESILCVNFLPPGRVWFGCMFWKQPVTARPIVASISRPPSSTLTRSSSREREACASERDSNIHHRFRTTDGWQLRSIPPGQWCLVD